MEQAEEIRARLALMIAGGGSPATLRRVLSNFSTAVEARSSSSLSARIRQGLQCSSMDDQVNAQLMGAQSIGATWCLAESFPSVALQSHRGLLCVRGSLSSTVAVAVVGARKADEYGRFTAQLLGSALAGGGISVVSGAAAGVDEAAHRAVLNAKGHTVAVLGTGLAGERNRERLTLHDAILSGGGALVSEYLLHAKGARWTFPERNQVIAKWGSAVVVVQAKRKSGALITAKAAQNHAIPLFAVPGDVGHPLSEGTNTLIAQGKAQLLQHVGDLAVVTGVSALSEASWPSRVRSTSALRPISSLTTGLNERDKVLQAITKQPGLALALLREQVGPLDQGQTLPEILLDLELENQVKRRPDDTYEVLQ